MFATVLIITSCIIFQRAILGRIHGDLLEFSGNALVNDKYVWVMITGSLIHASLSHEVNNLLFTFIVSYIMETQFLLSSKWIIFVFTATGMFGWIFSFLYHLHKHGQIAYFIPARGYSPNMYGAAYFCMMTYPKHTMNNIFSIHPVLWLLSIVIIPSYLTNNSKHRPVLWTVICIGICSITVIVYKHTDLLQNITLGRFLSLYLIKCFISMSCICRNKAQM